MSLALLVVDLQGVVLVGSPDGDELVVRVAGLAEAARGAGTPVVWVQHHDLVDPTEMPGAPGWELADGLEPADGEPVVVKHFRDSFAETGLEELLRGMGVDHVVLVGAQTDFCVQTTFHGAVVRGFDVTVVSDGHTTRDVVLDGLPALAAAQVSAHWNAYVRGYRHPGRTVRLLPAAEVVFGRPASRRQASGGGSVGPCPRP